MSDDPQQEYAEARAAYNAAMERLREAKKRLPQTSHDRYRQRRREKREAAIAHYLANKEAIDAQRERSINDVTAKALVILHQRLNAMRPLKSEDEE